MGKFKLTPPVDDKAPKNDDTVSPASSRLSDGSETANIQFRVTPSKRNEIKMYALEKNMSVKELFISLYEKDRME